MTGRLSSFIAAAKERRRCSGTAQGMRLAKVVELAFEDTSEVVGGVTITIPDHLAACTAEDAPGLDVAAVAIAGMRDAEELLVEGHLCPISP